MLILRALHTTVAAMYRPGFRTASLSPDIKVTESTNICKLPRPAWCVAVVSGWRIEVVSFANDWFGAAFSWFRRACPR